MMPRTCPTGFYRIDRKMLRLRADFVGDIIKDRLNWFAGLEYYNNKVAPVDREKLDMPDATTFMNIIPTNGISSRRIRPAADSRP